jgi:hypothetical protein
MFKQQVITVWMIVYDGEADQVYTTTSFDKMLASIESSLRGFYGQDDPGAEEVYQQIIAKVRSAEKSPAIPMRFGPLSIVVYRWEIDDSNKIHSILGQCHDIIEDSYLKEEIESLFSASVFT